MKPLSEMTDDELRAEHARRTQVVSDEPDPATGKSPADMSDEELAQEYANRQPGSLSRKVEGGLAALRTGTENLLGFPADVSGLVEPVVKKGSDILTKALRMAGINAPGLDEAEYKEGLFGERDAVKKQIEQFGSESIRENVTDPIVGERTFEAKTPGEKYTTSILEAAPSAALGPTRLAAKGLQAVATGVGAQAGEDVTKGTKFEPYGRLIGGVGGSLAAPGVLYGRGPFGTRGGSGNAGYDDAVDELSGRGVTTTAGQRLNSRGLRIAENELGGGTFDRMLQGQSDQFTQSIMGDIGFPGRRATPENLVLARREIGGTMDELAATTATPLDQTLQQNMLDTVTQYQDVAGTVAPGVERIMNRVSELATRNGGVLSGEAYQNVMTELRQLADAASGTPAEGAFRTLRDHIDDAVGRNMGPEQQAAWQTARDRYRGLMTVERAMTGRGQDAAGFDISPGALRSSISAEGPASIAEGRNTLTHPANAGVEVMTDRPNSGTAGRVATRAAAAAAPAAFGLGASPDVLKAMLAPYLIGKALMSRDVQAMMAPGDRLRRVLAATMSVPGSGGGPR